MAPEEGAIKQAANLANLPFIHKWVSLMPDTHQGYGMPIGGVLATKGVVIPNAVGVDIGCGMCSIESDIKEWTKENLTDVIKEIRYEVPVGRNHHKDAKDKSKIPDFQSDTITDVVKDQLDRALYQVGTLGGGNHFIELQRNPLGNLCVMIHSGSRNVGKQVADYYNTLAEELNARWHSTVPAEHDLAFLPLDSEQGQAYVKEMTYCVDFALANRREMMNACMQAIFKVFKAIGVTVNFNSFINIAHNYARMENHYGDNVMVHRKGATSARLGEVGLIPGSQGTKSYIVQGRGNKESFESCSHGAGRKMGRKQAQRTLDLEAEKKALDDKGIIHAVRATENLDEAPSAYKDIDVVMEEQKDLVSILVELTPLAVMKG
jgi:tRNA-splicing ligase RtcB